MRSSIDQPRPTKAQDVSSLLVAAGLAGWFWTVVLSNHPISTFDRARKRYEQWSVAVPNWRFFAPNPAQHDFALLYRTRSRAGDVSEWMYVREPVQRNLSNMVFFPGRRGGKAVHDLVVSLLICLRRLPPARVVETSQYRMLEAFVRRQMQAAWTGADPADGFQFALVRHAGYDETQDPDYLVISPYVPLEPAVAAK